MEIELKPCPFCNSEISAYSMVYEHGYFKKMKVHCSECGSEFNLSAESRFNDAVSIWNRNYTKVIRI